MAAAPVTKLSLNEACEAPYWLSSHVLQAGSFGLIAPAALFALWTLAGLPAGDTFGRHACLAQVLYHLTHAYIHAAVDMGVPAKAAFWNLVLVFHFAHQSGTLGSLYFRSFPKGLSIGFGAVYLTWGLTGMIYPAVWGYLATVFWFRSIMGWPNIASSVYTGLATVLEVRLCDPAALRSDGFAFPFHMLGDLGQATSVFLQCCYLARTAVARTAFEDFQAGKGEFQRAKAA